MKQAA
jgi:pre-rRNA-processing protein IPI3